MNKVSKIFISVILNIVLFKHNICASELLDTGMKEREATANMSSSITKSMQDSVTIVKPVTYTQGSSELCQGKAFKEWVQKIDQQWTQKHENYQDKLMILSPFAVGEAMILKNVVNLSLPQSAGVLVGSWLLADFITGAVHCFFDNFSITSKDYQSLSFLEERALTFQGHHYFPNKVTKSSYWFLTQDSYLLAFPFLAAGGILSVYGYDMSACLIGMTAFLGAQAHYTHALSHGKNASNRFVKFLQKTGLIISPQVHHVHHQDPEHAANYCIFNGHMNWALDALISIGRSNYKFFRNWFGSKSIKKD